MLIIRAAQMAALAELRRKSFKSRLRDHLVRLTPAQQIFPGELYDFRIDDLISSSAECGLKTEADVAALAQLLYLHTLTFDILALSKECQNALYEYGVEPDQKLQHLEQLLHPAQ